MDHGWSHKILALIHDGTLPPSPSSMYSPQTKPSGYLKAGMGQPSSRKQIMGGLTATDSTRGSLHWMKSISFIALSLCTSLYSWSLKQTRRSTSNGDTRDMGMETLSYT